MTGCGGCSVCASTFAYDAWRELKGIPFRDDPFTDEQWNQHVTWRRYIPEPSISGLVILSLAPVWLWSVLVSMGVGLYATYAEPNGWPNVSQHPDLITIFSLTSFALSLLMLFKTTTSYNRWWEARTLWGSGYITVRSVLRLSMSFVGRRRPHLVPAIHRWTAAVMPTLAAHLRGRSHYLEHLEGVMHPDELAWLAARGTGRGNAPVAALQVLSRLLDSAELEPMERQQVELLLNQLDVVVGGCERIRSQPIPYAWNRHTHRFILCYITFLPFAFWSLYGWATLPIMAVFSFLLAGVENVGIQIEEPHRVLPLNHMCTATIRALSFMMADERASADMAGFAAGVSAASLAQPELAVAMPPHVQHMAAKQDPQAAPLQAFLASSSSESGDSHGHANGGAKGSPRQRPRGGRSRALPPDSASDVELTLPSATAVVVDAPAVRDHTSPQ